MSISPSRTPRSSDVSTAGAVEILNGFIWYGTFTSPPNMWITLKVSEVNVLGGKAVEIVQSKEVPLLEFMQYVCQQYHNVEGVPFSLYDNTEDQILEDE